VLARAVPASPNFVGADIDAEALSVAKRDAVPGARFIQHNSLLKSSRKDYGIAADVRLVVVGNPPYNDTTAMAGRTEKAGGAPALLPRYKTRDLGVSFLRSYADLKPDFVCVLHPLSYLVKKANFAALGDFARLYALIDSVIVSSEEFSGTGRSGTFFPIVVALYRRYANGMDYEYIRNFVFKTDCGKSFRVADFTPLGEFVTFYPNAKRVAESDTVARFFAMRDINALRRNRAFIENDGAHAIRITRETLPYYQYAAAFKRHAHHVPYYLGNLPVFIDHAEFLKIKNWDDDAAAGAYFRRLLGEHFIEQ
jgi:hypothetical protein